MSRVLFFTLPYLRSLSLPPFLAVRSHRFIPTSLPCCSIISEFLCFLTYNNTLKTMLRRVTNALLASLQVILHMFLKNPHTSSRLTHSRTCRTPLNRERLCFKCPCQHAMSMFQSFPPQQVVSVLRFVPTQQRKFLYFDIFPLNRERLCFDFPAQQTVSWF